MYSAILALTTRDKKITGGTELHTASDMTLTYTNTYNKWHADPICGDNSPMQWMKQQRWSYTAGNQATPEEPQKNRHWVEFHMVQFCGHCCSYATSMICQTSCRPIFTCTQMTLRLKNKQAINLEELWDITVISGVHSALVWEVADKV